MENTYSITVTNKFSLALDEDQDPLEILKLREQEKEAKKKEKLSEKEKAKQHQQEQPKQNAAANKPKPRANKENQHQQQIQPQHQQQAQRNQDAKKDQGEKKLTQQKFGGGNRDGNVKFESREEHNNRRNREDGDRPPRSQNDRRGPPGEGREPRDYQPREQQPHREFRNSEYGGGERRGGRGGARGMGRGGRGGGFRGGRGGGYDNRGKREFDRQSGSDKTGIKPIDKRDGAGSHNWGTHNDEIEESLNTTTDDWNTEKPEADVAPGANDSAGSAGGAPSTDSGVAPEEKPVEEETRELTLDEWKALRQNRTKPQYNLRKAGEGEDLSRWKKMYALERKKEDAEDNEDDEDYDVTEYPQRVGRQKHLFDIEIQFNDSRRSAGGRGGRGGRGRGDRGGGRGFNRGPPRSDNDFRNNEQRSPRERQNAPKVDDEHDFPSLG